MLRLTGTYRIYLDFKRYLNFIIFKQRIIGIAYNNTHFVNIFSV